MRIYFYHAGGWSDNTTTGADNLSSPDSPNSSLEVPLSCPETPLSCPDTFSLSPDTPPSQYSPSSPCVPDKERFRLTAVIPDTQRSEFPGKFPLLSDERRLDADNIFRCIFGAETVL